MNTIENHLRLCSKDMKQVSPDVYAIINNNDELNICCYGAHVRIPLSHIITVNDNAFAIIIKASKEMGIYDKGRLVAEVSTANNGLLDSVKYILASLLLKKTVDKLPSEISVRIYVNTRGRIFHEYSINLAKTTIAIDNQNHILYLNKNKTCYQNSLDISFMIRDRNLLFISNDIPKFIMKMGYAYYVDESGSLSVVNLRTNRQFTFDAERYSNLRCISSYSSYYDSKEGYLLCFLPKRHYPRSSGYGFVLFLPHDDSEVKIYKGCLSYKTKLIYHCDFYKSKVLTVHTLDNKILAKDSIVSWANPRYVICGSFIYDIVNGEIHNMRVYRVARATLKAAKGNVYILRVVTDNGEFYELQDGELVNFGMSSLYYYSKKYRDKTSESSEIRVAKFKSNGLYVITDSAGFPIYDVLFDSEKQAVEYVMSDTHVTFKRVTFE